LRTGVASRHAGNNVGAPTIHRNSAGSSAMDNVRGTLIATSSANNNVIDQNVTCNRVRRVLSRSHQPKARAQNHRGKMLSVMKECPRAAAGAAVGAADVMRCAKPNLWARMQSVRFLQALPQLRRMLLPQRHIPFLQQWGRAR